MNRTAAASAEARAKVTDYVKTLFEAGEKDTHKLTVCGLTYLRELDGSSDPVKAGYTGLYDQMWFTCSVPFQRSFGTRTQADDGKVGCCSEQMRHAPSRAWGVIRFSI